MRSNWFAIKWRSWQTTPEFSEKISLIFFSCDENWKLHNFFESFLSLSLQMPLYDEMSFRCAVARSFSSYNANEMPLARIAPKANIYF